MTGHHADSRGRKSESAGRAYRYRGLVGVKIVDGSDKPCHTIGSHRRGPFVNKTEQVGSPMAAVITPGIAVVVVDKGQLSTRRKVGGLLAMEIGHHRPAITEQGDE